MNLNGSEYYYIRSAQGDIIGLIDNTGTQVVSYTYDTWGKLTSTTGSLASTVGAKNPYLYRGYRYDSETGLYYLQSRYYNPDWGRFVNADTLAGQVGELLSHNVFAYCSNNAVNREDSDGDSWELVLGSTIIAPEVMVVAAAGGLLFYLGYQAYDYWNRHHIKYESDNPIADGMEERIPNDRLVPPNERGNAPTSVEDGHPIEIHHKGQNPAGPYVEKTRTSHRLGENYKKNHPRYKEKSKIDRKTFKKQTKKYWKGEWDRGRWK